LCVGSEIGQKGVEVGLVSAVGCEAAFITETEVIYETWLRAGLRYDYEKEATNIGIQP